MIDQVIAAFPELTDLTQIPIMGGQKDVFRARRSDGSDVALKIIKTGPTAHDRADREVVAIEKLKANTSAIGGMNSPMIFDSGIRSIAGQSRYFIIEQFINGRNLREVLTSSPTLGLLDTLRLARTLIGACVDFESVKMVHRDINPRNVMVDTAGRYWVIDLGLVRHLDMVSITSDGKYRGIGGTPGYAPIEVFQNNKGEENVRSDLFSSGVVLYEVISGANPYTAGAPNAPAIYSRVESTDLPRLHIEGDKGDRLAEFIATLTQRFPSRRPQTGIEAGDWLRDILSDHGIV